MYSITVDPGTRLIRAVVGGHQSAEEITQFSAELQVRARALHAAAGKFDVLLDMREALILPQELTTAVQASMRWLVNNGLARNAYLVGSALMKMQFNRIAISTAFACFQTEMDALAWIAAD